MENSLPHALADFPLPSHLAIIQQIGAVGDSRSGKLFNGMEEKTDFIFQKFWLYFSKACLEPKGHFL